jgi:triosephosphate isomerase
MRRALVAANWKMNGSRTLVTELLSAFRDNIATEHVDAVVFPPAVFLPLTEELLSGSGLAWGGQNCHHLDSGAYTGEISLPMLKEFGCQFVLVGHSERRSLFGETNQVVADKVEAALNSGVTPMICVGETLDQREADQTEQVVAEQIQAVLDRVGSEGLGKSVIAYEPVWAIGTGKTASPEQAQQVHSFIRGLVAKADTNVAENIHILYGGSVNAGNAQQLFAMKDIDGGLVGGASLKADEFVAICAAAE